MKDVRRLVNNENQTLWEVPNIITGGEISVHECGHVLLSKDLEDPKNRWILYDACDQDFDKIYQVKVYLDDTFAMTKEDVRLGYIGNPICELQGPEGAEMCYYFSLLESETEDDDNDESSEKYVEILQEDGSVRRTPYDEIVADDDLEDDEEDVPETTNDINVDVHGKSGFGAVAGMESLKKQLEEDVLFPLRNKELMERYKLRPLNGMLLYGPPGCGKTYIARRFAEESGMPFKFIRSSDVSGMCIHETSGGIKRLFAEAKRLAPCVVCVDEIDAIVPNRSVAGESNADLAESVNEFLSQMSDCSKHGIFVIGTTNCPQNIDRAMLRTGRMDSLVYVPLPDEECRRQMIAYHLADRPMDADIDYNVLAELSKGMNASDIETMVNVVAMNAARSRSMISQQMLEEQARSQRRSVILGKEKDGNEFAKMISMQPTRDRQAIGFTAYKS